MQFVNLTPHTINNAMTGEAFAASGSVARVSVKEEEIAPGFFSQVTGEVQGLPFQQDGVIFIVSAMVRMAVPGRSDIVSPGALVRDEEGNPVGCKGFSVNPGFKI